MVILHRTVSKIKEKQSKKTKLFVINVDHPSIQLNNVVLLLRHILMQNVSFVMKMDTYQ